MASIADMTALSLARAIRSRALSSEAVVRHHLDQIEALNPRMGAFVSVIGARAMRHARRVDRHLAQKGADGAPIFLGVPTGIKDLDFVRGTWTRLGSKATRMLWSPADGPVAKRIRAGGFVILGKLATSEFGIMPITETDLHPPCRNPWNTNHTPGGSSGGSASAVSGGLLPIAQASDGAGSIRIPAAFCHLVGFKASRGLMPNFYEAFDPAGMTNVGSVSHDVDDTAAMLDVLTGARYDPNHPSPGSLLDACRRPQKGLRIAFVRASPIGSPSPHIIEGVERVARVLEDLGHHVYDIDVETGTLDEFLPVYAYMSSRIPVMNASSLQPPSRWLREQSRGVTRQRVLDTVQVLTERIERWFGDADVCLSPTVGLSPPALGQWLDLDGEGQFRAAAELGSYTALSNISGHCAVSIPAGLGDGQLPFGAMLAARQGRDKMLLALARQLEEAIPWRDRRAAP